MAYHNFTSRQIKRFVHVETSGEAPEAIKVVISTE